MSSSCYLPWLKKHLHMTAHWEKMKAHDVQQAIDYCKKDGKWHEFGTIALGQGHRSDWDALKADINTVAMQEISDKHFRLFVQNYRGLMRYKEMNYTPCVREPPMILWMFGASGTGKTVTLNGMLHSSMNKSYFLSSSNSGSGVWWEGYCEQSIVCMDELRGSWMKHSDLLRVLDSAPHRVPTKGGSAALVASTFLITTNQPPEALFAEDPSGAFIRRIHDFAWVYEISKDCTRMRSFPNLHGQSMTALLKKLTSSSVGSKTESISVE